MAGYNWLLFTSFYLFLCCISKGAPIEDPCNTATLLEDDGGRSTTCHVSYDKCDRYILPGWYRVQLNTGEDRTMPTSPVPVNSCGTKYPIWLNGSDPVVSDGVVDRICCITSFTSTCELNYPIQVKNCTDYMVYNLVRATGCNQRYCFGEDEGPCDPPTSQITQTQSTPAGSTTTTLKQEPRTTPVEPRPPTTPAPIQGAPIEDPCNNATLLEDDGGRSTTCHVSYEKCDRYILPGWYRVQLNNGEDRTMPTSPVPVNSCGTKYPIWLNGSDPVVSDGVVDRMCCVTSFDSTCKLNYPIQVKNCTDYMVYNLIRARGCNQRYCFGEDEGPCDPTTSQITQAKSTPAGSTTTTTTTPTKSTTLKQEPRTTPVEPRPPTTPAPIQGAPIEDPCNNATLLEDDGGRSTTCQVSYDKCDRYILPGWYRVQLNNGEDITMPTSPVPVNSCGTKYPIWLNGNDPIVSDGVVDRVCCVTSFTSTCQLNYPIQVKNCTDYMVYNLVRATGCNQRYCFGEDEGPCDPTKITQTSQKSTPAESTTTTTTTESTPAESTTLTQEPMTTPVEPRPPTYPAEEPIRGDFTEVVFVTIGIAAVSVMVTVVVIVGVIVWMRKTAQLAKTMPVYEYVTAPVSKKLPMFPPQPSVDDKLTYERLDQVTRIQQINPCETDVYSQLHLTGIAPTSTSLMTNAKM